MNWSCVTRGRVELIGESAVKEPWTNGMAFWPRSSLKQRFECQGQAFENCPQVRFEPDLFYRSNQDPVSLSLWLTEPWDRGLSFESHKHGSGFRAWARACYTSHQVGSFVFRQASLISLFFAKTQKCWFFSFLVIQILRDGDVKRFSHNFWELKTVSANFGITWQS